MAQITRGDHIAVGVMSPSSPAAAAASASPATSPSVHGAPLRCCYCFGGAGCQARATPTAYRDPALGSKGHENAKEDWKRWMMNRWFGSRFKSKSQSKGFHHHIQIDDTTTSNISNH
uniref:Uncharacterized protein n=1 Tax=Oryza nivara TaxID=4536 RepID=A0A0E0I4C9_ORYNI